ncbi:MAG: hypothetical protein WC989_08795 [Micavibrio sp.]
MTALSRQGAASAAPVSLTRIKRTSSFLARYRGPVFAGGLSGILFHGAHYGAVAAGTGLAIGLSPAAGLAFNAILSATCLGASYWAWHRFMGGHACTAQEKSSSAAIQAGLALAVAFGAHAYGGHDHSGGAKAEWFAALPETMRQEMLEGARKTYLGLPENLRARLELAAANENTPPEIWIVICSDKDVLGHQVRKFIKQKQDDASKQSMGGAEPAP